MARMTWHTAISGLLLFRLRDGCVSRRHPGGEGCPRYKHESSREGVEQPVCILGGNSDAAIGHADDRAGRLVPG